MDIRSIIDADDAPPPRKRSGPGSVHQEHRPHPAGYPNRQEAQAPIYQERRDGRPPQPSPLQTPGRSENWANGLSHSAVRSPYQQTPPSGLSSGQHLPPHIPNQGPVHGPQYSQRESYPSSGAPINRSFGPSTPLSQTPTTSTPGSSVHGYSNLGRPSSSHSVKTPNSAQQAPSYFRDSPQVSHTQLRSLSQSQAGPQYMSQPSTPLGPPSTFPRSNFSLRRESPGTYHREPTLPGGSYGQPQTASPSQAAAGSPQTHGVRQSQSMSHEPMYLRIRERSLSVSPKTRLPSLPSMNSSEILLSEAGAWNEQVMHVKRKVEVTSPDPASVREPTMNRTQSRQSRMSSIGVNGLLNAAPNEPSERVNRHPQSEIPSILNTEGKNTSFDYMRRNDTPSAPFDASPPSVPQVPSSAKMPSPAKIEASTLIDSPSKPTKKRAHDQGPADDDRTPTIGLEETENDSSSNQTSIPSQPAKKKPRLRDTPDNPTPASVENNDSNQPTNTPDPKSDPKSHPEKKQKPSRWKKIPIWAQSVPRHNRPLNGNPRPPVSRQAPNALAPGQSNGHPKAMQEAKGNSNQANGVHVPVAQPSLANTGPLGPWEPSFVNVIPAEELVRILSDWLFQNVVQRDDVGVAPAGGGTGGGAVLEIEAKIGQLIDKNTNDRLRLPVLNECIVSHSDPNIRVAFKSSMTEVGPSLRALSRHPC